MHANLNTKIRVAHTIERNTNVFNPQTTSIQRYARIIIVIVIHACHSRRKAVVDAIRTNGGWKLCLSASAHRQRSLT